jgi:hypothetical protein
MWRRKAAAAGVLWLTTGCATAQDQRANQIGDVVTRMEADVQLEGCLSTGAEPGTFLLADVTGVAPGGPSARGIKVLSTRLGLSAHVGRRVSVRGQEQATPPRSIHGGATLFWIRALDVVEDATLWPTSRSARCP